MTIDPSQLTSSQIGVGIVIALFAFEKIVAFTERISKITNKRNSGADNTAGQQSVDFWKREFDKVNVGIEKIIEVQAVTAHQQAETAKILDRMATQQQEHNMWTGQDRRSQRGQH